MEMMIQNDFHNIIRRLNESECGLMLSHLPCTDDNVGIFRLLLEAFELLMLFYYDGCLWGLWLMMKIKSENFEIK